MNKTYPITLINIHLPSEPITKERSYCLRQLSDNEWVTTYYDEDKDYFYHGKYFPTLEEATEEFRTEMNRQMERYNHFISMFFKYRDYILKQETRN